MTASFYAYLSVVWDQKGYMLNWKGERNCCVKGSLKVVEGAGAVRGKMCGLCLVTASTGEQIIQNLAIY